MKEREIIIANYIDGYNTFNIDKMVTDFDENIIFENISDGKINISLKGLSSFVQQAEQAKNYFLVRTQIVKSYKHQNDETEININYTATLAIDLPHGLRKGEELNLQGKSVFKFLGSKIIKLTDIS